MNTLANRALATAAALGIILASSGTAHATELSPSLSITGDSTMLSLGQPWGATSDSDGKIYVAIRNSGVLVFDGATPGDVAPETLITNLAEDLDNVFDVEIGPTGLIFVTHGNGILVFPADAEGPTAPLREITGFEGYGLEIGVDGTIYVTLNADDGLVDGGSVYVFAADADGEAEPLKVLPGDGDSVDVAVDELGTVYLSNYAESKIDIWTADAESGSEASRVISGAATLLDQPFGIDVTCSTGTIVVGNSETSEILEFPATAAGDVAATVLVSEIGSDGLGIGANGKLIISANAGPSVISYDYEAPCDAGLAETGVDAGPSTLLVAGLFTAGGIALAIRRRNAR